MYRNIKWIIIGLKICKDTLRRNKDFGLSCTELNNRLDPKLPIRENRELINDLYMYQLIKKKLFPSHSLLEKSFCTKFAHIGKMFVFTIPLSLPYGLYIAIILVSCALCLCPLPSHHSSPPPPPACMLHVSCACSSIFIVVFYVSRNCTVTSLSVHSIAFIHTHLPVWCLSLSEGISYRVHNVHKLCVLYVHKCTVLQRTYRNTVTM